MNCKTIQTCTILFINLILISCAHQLNNSLCSSSSIYPCLSSPNQREENQQHKKQVSFVTPGENFSKRRYLTEVAPFLKPFPESGRNRKKIRKKKHNKKLKYMKRRRRRRHKRPNLREYAPKRSFNNNLNNLKKGFDSSYYNKNEGVIYSKHQKIFFPVTNFGNFTSNDVHSTWESNPRVEFRKSYYKKRRSRYRHLNPHSMKVKKLIVRIHNVLRGKVSPPARNMLAMSWHEAASEQAQRWADECKPSATSDHPSVRWTPLYGTCGQNVYVAFKKKRWGRVVRHWWNERRYFRFGYTNNYTKVHQYTQMAWYNSHKVGCGFAQCSNRMGKTFFRYVCNYCPGGNDPRRLSEPYSRGQQCESCPNSCRSVCKGGRCKLCTNACPFSDLWANCKSLSHHWKEWLCTTRTGEGINRFKNCRATCQCKDKIM